MAIQSKFIRALSELKEGMSSKNRTLGFIIQALINYPGNHIEDKDNPHDVKASDMGLENLPNWPPATKEQAIEGTNASALLSPKRLDDYMDSNVYAPLSQIFDAAADRL